MDLPVIFIIAVLVIYLAWKLMGANSKRAKQQPRRFSSGRRSQKKKEDDEL